MKKTIAQFVPRISRLFQEVEKDMNFREKAADAALEHYWETRIRDNAATYVISAIWWYLSLEITQLKTIHLEMISKNVNLTSPKLMQRALEKRLTALEKRYNVK